MGFSHGKIMCMRAYESKAWIENQALNSQENNSILSVEISRVLKT